jgi:hypothetical protein
VYPYNTTTNRTYYGPSLQDPRSQKTLWSNRPPSAFYQDQSSVNNAAVIGAGIAAAGSIPIRGSRVWDYYVAGIRGAEEYSPGGVLRTFQASTFFSQFTTQGRKGFRVSGDYLAGSQGKPLRDYLTTMIGESGGTYARLGKEGLRFSKGKLFWGTTGDIALPYAGTMISPTAGKLAGMEHIAGKHLGSAYARSMGFSTKGWKGFAEDDARLFGQVFKTSKGEYHKQIIGARTLPGYVGRQLGGIGTEFVSRFNRLLRAPFEMEPFKTVFGKGQELLGRATGGRSLQFAVPQGPGLKMLGNLVMKYGLGLGAISLGYQTLDYTTRNADFLNETAFGEGLTTGLATIGIKANLAISKVAEATGLHTYREAQESIAPGSTSLQKLLAFPLLGGLTAASSIYLTRIAKTVKYQRQGLGAAAAAARAKEDLQVFGGPLGRLGKQLSRSSGLYSRTDWIGRATRYIGTANKAGDVSYKFVGKIGPAKLFGLLGAGIGVASVLPFLPGATIPSQRPDVLKAIYSGEQEVAIRKGRGWEFGRSPYEGQRISHFRPHWYPRMIMRAREKSLYGEERSPIENFIRKEFTYDWELEHYKDRPYPITALPFEDVPFIGPLLANTLGRIIKPPKLMHTDEWMDDDYIKVMAPTFGDRRATEIGELPPPKPISPYSVKGTLGEQIYRMTEMIGLPGFTMSTIKDKLTGTSDFFDQHAQLESARRAFGAERAYWDLEIGGGLGTTETLRRLYPHRRRQIPLYNPIRNLMPNWLPGPGEKGPDFLHGDPYVQIQEGELRLPGKGYEARYPELKGIAAEDYPLIHKYKILADVALYTDKYKEISRTIRSARTKDNWSEYEEQIYQTVEEQVVQRKTRKEFQDYRYLSPMGNITDKNNYYGGEGSSALIAQINQMKAAGETRPGVFSKLFGGYWELLAHNAETAIDQLTPVSPGAKLVHTRTALEDYERTQVYGTENAFWQHPIRDFIRPFSNLTAKSFGFDSIPDHVENRRALEEHFDILKYAKNTRLARLANMAGDTDAAKEFERKKDETMFGLNPYTFNYRSIFRALPRRSRDYFNAFADADTVEERESILKLVPDNEKALYIARWAMKFGEEVKQARKAGILSENQLEEAEVIINDIHQDAKSEGFPTSEELSAEYIATRLDKETYGDWYRRTKLLANIPLPGEDWVGWHPSVDLEDIKLKVVQNLGEDIHDYDLWSSGAQELQNKPYINNEVVEELTKNKNLSDREMEEQIERLFNVNGVTANIFTRNTLSGDNMLSMNIEQDVNVTGALSKIL